MTQPSTSPVAFNALYLTSTDAVAQGAYVVRRRHEPGEPLRAVLGYVRTGMRSGVECYLWSDSNASVHSRSAWRIIGPLASFSGLAEAALSVVEPVPASPLEPGVSVVGTPAEASEAAAPAHVTVRDNVCRAEWRASGADPSDAFARVLKDVPRAGMATDTRDAFNAAWLHYRGATSAATRGDVTVTIEPAPAAPAPVEPVQADPLAASVVAAHCSEAMGRERVGDSEGAARALKRAADKASAHGLDVHAAVDAANRASDAAAMIAAPYEAAARAEGWTVDGGMFVHHGLRTTAEASPLDPESWEMLCREHGIDAAPMVPQPVQPQQACAFRFTVRNDNPATIWNRLAARLGREPTAAEAKAAVQRILRGEAL